MKKDLHVVLGGGGAIGQAVIKELKARKLPTVAVEHSKELENVKTIKADLSDKEATIDALSEATHVYMCVGLPYRTKAWQQLWPPIIENVIAACAAANAKLIFFDNIYAYGPPPLPVPFDESTPQKPHTAKGKVRKQLADMVTEAGRNGQIQAVIGRSADFYGPNAVNSPFYIVFLERMLKEQSATVAR
jgi:nucleoside-diphosphate-sugar epimerase